MDYLNFNEVKQRFVDEVKLWFLDDYTNALIKLPSQAFDNGGHILFSHVKDSKSGDELYWIAVAKRNHFPIVNDYIGNHIQMIEWYNIDFEEHLDLIVKIQSLYLSFLASDERVNDYIQSLIETDFANTELDRNEEDQNFTYRVIGALDIYNILFQDWEFPPISSNTIENYEQEIIDFKKTTKTIYYQD